MKYIVQNYLCCSIPVLILTVLLSEDRICNAQYVPGNYNPQPGTFYTANREVRPQETAGTAVQPKQVAETPENTVVNAAVPETKPEEQKSSNPFTKMYRYWFPAKDKDKNKDTAAVKPSQNTSPAPDARISNQEYAETKAPVSEKKAWYEFWKKSEENTDSKEQKLDTSVDKGQEEVALLEQERSFSEKDYLDSAVKSDKTAAKNDYAQGLQLEGLGDYDGAARCYNNFIQANKKQTSNGTLAAPYHRLALLAWKQKELDKADVYFRYGQRYAQGGNIAVISGDYSLFLMEQGKTEQAEVILRNTLLHFPKDQRLLICLGRCCARRDKPIEALRYLNSVMSEEQAYHELAGLYQETGDYKSAQIMNEKRDELFAKRSGSSYNSHPAANPVNNSAYQYADAANNQNMPLPLNRPPVMNSAINPAANSTSAMPYPVINPVLPTGSPASGSWTDLQPAAIPYRLPQEMNAAPQTVPFSSTLPSNGQPDGNTAQEKQTVTKVYHYPANSPSPVYHQYTGSSYPQMVPVRVQSASNPNDVKNYWASTVPDSSASATGSAAATISADPFAVQPSLPVFPQQPIPMVAEQRGGYPPVPSYPKNGNVQ